jgi:hypothetical protein
VNGERLHAGQLTALGTAVSGTASSGLGHACNVSPLFSKVRVASRSDDMGLKC